MDNKQENLTSNKKIIVSKLDKAARDESDLEGKGYFGEADWKHNERGGDIHHQEKQRVIIMYQC